MGLSRIIKFSVALPFLIIGTIQLSLFTACKRFVPELVLHITTDSIITLPGREYKLIGTLESFGYDKVTQHGFCYGESRDPTTDDLTTQLGARDMKGRFESILSDLSPSTTFYVRSYVVTRAGIEYGDEKTFTTPELTEETVTDFDGNVYQTVQIGDQTWMRSNLKVTHYPDGKEIPLVEEDATWSDLDDLSEAYCWYGNSTSNRDTYGGLYTWAAAMYGASGSDAIPSQVQGICPEGWHLPSDGEWKKLEVFLGMGETDADEDGWRGNDQGGQLKDTGMALWISPNRGATNESGFTAFPGGLRGIAGSFYNVGFDAYFWTATDCSGSNARYRNLTNDDGDIFRDCYLKYIGFSVRCVKD